MIRVKNRVFLANEKRSASSPKEICWGPTIYWSKQNKTKLKAKVNLQEKRIEYEAIKNIVCWKVTWFLPMKKGCLGGIPKLWHLYLLDIYWGHMGIPKLELLSILHLISSLSILYTWKLPSYKTSHNSISNVSISIILNQPFWFSFKLKNTPYK
jgi:hypothetical protein